MLSAHPCPQSQPALGAWSWLSSELGPCSLRSSLAWVKRDSYRLDVTMATSRLAQMKASLVMKMMK